MSFFKAKGLKIVETPKTNQIQLFKDGLKQKNILLLYTYVSFLIKPMINDDFNGP